MSEHGGHHGGGDTGGGPAGGSDFGGHHSHGGQAGHSGSFPDGSAHGHQGHQGHHAHHGHGEYSAHGAPGQLNDQWLPYEGIYSPADPAARRRATARRGRKGPIAGTPGARIAVAVFAIVALSILAFFGFILAAIFA
jgi:hypothetical protein